ncbi:PCI domain-containing protein [Blumeria hordei DH14]|uniref:PCI domain-containing protein n=1 Tax=Blumeria graminis f. sp. hordei (strain DH14) TaxID=546991 RepID=N1JIY3_BLUG1|nr:PCI domain-containing protein [Blumeria hordei DH14]
MTLIENYLNAVASFLRIRDGSQLQKVFQVEPPLPFEFSQLSIETKNRFPKENPDSLDGSNEKIDRLIEKLVPISEEEFIDSNEVGSAWPAFQILLREYLKFWRDVDFSDPLITHTLLSEVTYACITSLSHPSHGSVLLPAAVYLCSCLAKLTMMLDKRPDLTARIRKFADEGERKTLVESTAETIQRAFTICLTERTTNRNGIARDGGPESKKVEIYKFANMVLRLLYQCRKPRLASQIFTNILQNSPPLGIYPAGQRVTYLYFLGRYHFTTNHFYHAQCCLEAAYSQCPNKFIKHRRLIMIHLVSANIILGRFPSKELFSRPETADILAKFLPLVKAIRTGDMILFKKALGPESGNQRWFFEKGILLPLLGRCEMLVWRSLARKVFLLTYHFPLDPNSRKAPTLDVQDMVTAAQYCQKVLEDWKMPIDNIAVAQSGRLHPNTMFNKPLHLTPPPEGPRKLGAQEGLIYGNTMPDYMHIEAIIASLVQQGLIYGFLSHSQGKFAIIGSKQRGGPAEQEGKDSEIPGWVQQQRTIGAGGVINLSGARPAGAD